MPSELDLTWKEQPPVPSAAIMTNQLSRKRAHGPCHDASAVLPALAFCPIGSQKIDAYRLLTLPLKNLPSRRRAGKSFWCVFCYDNVSDGNCKIAYGDPFHELDMSGDLIDLRQFDANSHQQRSSGVYVDWCSTFDSVGSQALTH
jgi:hypothetical protein